MSQRLRAIVNGDDRPARQRGHGSRSGRRCAAACGLSRRQHERERARRLRGRAGPFAGAPRRADRGGGLDRGNRSQAWRRRQPRRPPWRLRSTRPAPAVAAKGGAGFVGWIEWRAATSAAGAGDLRAGGLRHSHGRARHRAAYPPATAVRNPADRAARRHRHVAAVHAAPPRSGRSCRRCRATRSS